MAISITQTVTGSVATGNTVSLTSWTPSAWDLILLVVATRDDTPNISSVAGNGLTWQLVRSVRNDDEECCLRLYRAQGASPSTGQVVVTFSGNSVPVMCVASRFAGCSTDGVNGSDAVEVVVYDDGPSSSSNDVLKAITTVSDNAWAVACATHRDSTLTVPGDETAISINNSVGTSSNVTTASIWYQETTTPGSVTLGESNDLNTSTDWVIIVASLKPSLIETTEILGKDYRRFTDRPRRVNFKTAGGDLICSAFGYAEILTSEYKGNEVQGFQVRDAIRVKLFHTLRNVVVRGDYVFISPVHSYLVISIKTFEDTTEVIATAEEVGPGAKPNRYVPVDLASGTAEIEIWQPVEGKRWRLLGVDFKMSGAASSKLIFRDGLAGNVKLVGVATEVYVSGELGQGILSSGINQSLTLERSVACALVGHVYGFEE